MRYPTATAAAAAETCKNERRERQAGFSSIDMILPPHRARTLREDWTQTITFLGSRASFLHRISCWRVFVSAKAALLGLCKKDSEEKEKEGRDHATHGELTSLYAID